MYIYVYGKSLGKFMLSLVIYTMQIYIHTHTDIYKVTMRHANGITQ